MRLFLLLVSVGLVACVGVSEPERDTRHCLYPGDTIGLGPLQTPDSTIVACIWVTEIKTRCYVGEVMRLSQATTPCIVGTKWTG